MKKTSVLVLSLALSGLSAFGAAPAQGLAACEKLTNIALPNVTVDSAEVIAAGALADPAGGGPPVLASLPAFCRVSATLTPSADSSIRAQLWLPVSAWNGKFQAVGNSGWSGSLQRGPMAASLAAGYAVAGTDTGHSGSNADFALGHPEKLIDLGYRAMHETTILSKTLIAAHYGVAPKVSYFEGCSQGGRQALAAAQKYPGDFDGIIAGAAGWDQMRTHAARVALNVTVNKNADNVIPASKYPMIHNAVLKACDGMDGVKDGVIENPASCTFDYASLTCRSGDGPDCLTKGQVTSAKAMTSPLKDPKTGRLLFESHLVPGSELGWGSLGGPSPPPVSVNILANIVFRNRSWDYRTMNISTDIDRAARSDDGVMHSGDPNLRPFFSRGGKLFMYHGWNDEVLSPFRSIAYYQNVVTVVGKEAAANSLALFMVPGMNHCGGGVGASAFNRMTVIEQWVEQGKKPVRITASRVTNGQPDRTRPLCPFGEVAKYNGSGSTNDAVNFSCVAASSNSRR